MGEITSADLRQTRASMDNLARHISELCALLRLPAGDFPVQRLFERLERLWPKVGARVLYTYSEPHRLATIVNIDLDQSETFPIELRVDGEQGTTWTSPGSIKPAAEAVEGCPACDSTGNYPDGRECQCCHGTKVACRDHYEGGHYSYMGAPCRNCGLPVAQWRYPEDTYCGGVKPWAHRKGETDEPK